VAEQPSKRAPVSAKDRGTSRPPRTARELAIRVLERVAERGAYASRALDAELARAKLADRDAALATEIVYGALRVLPELDRRIALHLRRPFDELDGVLRAALRAGCYQLAYLSRVPSHAVVDETVGAVRQERGASLAGVANAVLRKLGAERAAQEREPARGVIVAPWLARALEAALGAARATALLQGGKLPPPLALRVSASVSRDELGARLVAVRPGLELQPGQLSPHALLLRRAGDPRALPGYAEGEFCVQEEGAQVVACCLGALPGEVIADLCAGHGGKTVLLAEAVGRAGEVTAVDLDERKLERIPKELERLRLDSSRVSLRAIDLRVGLGGLTARFDRVLVDAPCTGLGTLRRRPELLLRVSETDPARLAQEQLAILRQAARLVRPGGVLLYAVCSPMPEEGAEVASRLEAELPSLARCRDAGDFGLPGLVPDPDGVLRLGPWLGGLDADSPDVYQVVRWRVTEHPAAPPNGLA
jgi:16S rRNA (cytosine967-C5)-methyltransferase